MVVPKTSYMIYLEKYFYMLEHQRQTSYRW